MEVKDFPEPIKSAVEGILNNITERETPLSIPQMIRKIREGIEQTGGVEAAVVFLQINDVSAYLKFLIRLARELDASRKAKEDAVATIQDVVYILQTIYNYSELESPISDTDYDVLYEFLNEYSGEMITVPIVNSNKIVYHKYKTLRGTLSKVYALGDEGVLNKSRLTLDDWIEQRQRMYKAATGKDIVLANEEVYLFPKWDGVSIVFEFDERNVLTRALTRGYTETNECQDVTDIFRTRQSSIRDDDMKGKPYGLKTEVMMTDKDKESFAKKYKTEYKNTRSIVSAIVNSDTVDGRENLLEIVGLRTTTLDGDDNESEQKLAADVFKRPYLRCPLNDRIAIRKFAEKHRNIKGLHTDGVVIHIINEDIQKVLGRKDDKNQFEVAYKFNEEVGYTKLKDIVFSVSGFGRIFPIAHVEPVTLKGNTIQKISLGSIGRMKELGLSKGDTVKVIYEIIPYIDFDDNDPKCIRKHGIPIPVPDTCPECGSELEVGGNADNAITCINPDCPARIRGKILKYVETCRIQGIGEGTIAKLNSAGYLGKIPDLYKLKKHVKALCKIDGFEEASVNKILDSIEEAGRRVDAATFMAAIGIESIGKKIFGKLFEEYDIRELIDFAVDKKISPLMAISGIGETQANKILYGLKENRKLIEELIDNYVDIDYGKASFIAVFHNIRSARLSDIIVQKGGRVDDNLTKATTILIVPDGFGDRSTSTADKARRYGVSIIEYSNVEEYLRKMK